MKNWSATLIALFAIAGCSDGRPDAEEARRQFETIYPEAQVIGTKITEDEVVARSYLFSYRYKATGQEGKIGIQFMKTDGGDWAPRPAPPKSLP